VNRANVDRPLPTEGNRFVFVVLMRRRCPGLAVDTPPETSMLLEHLSLDLRQSDKNDFTGHETATARPEVNMNQWAS